MKKVKSIEILEEDEVDVQNAIVESIGKLFEILTNPQNKTTLLHPLFSLGRSMHQGVRDRVSKINGLNDRF